MRQPAEQRQLDLIAWWSEIFQPPCVAFDVTSASHAQALAAAGADFIAVTVSPLTTTADATRTLAAYAEAITLSREPV